MIPTPEHHVSEMNELRQRVARMDKRFRLMMGTLLMVVAVGLVLWAPAVLSEPTAPVPCHDNDLYCFQANTPARADQVNSNFARLHDLVDAVATSSINGARIVNQTVTENKLASGAVTADKLAAGAITQQVKEYINTRCLIGLGWRNDCDNCTIPTPDRAVMSRPDGSNCLSFSTETGCGNGWLRLGTSGEVNENDTFYVSLQCL